MASLRRRLLKPGEAWRIFNSLGILTSALSPAATGGGREGLQHRLNHQKHVKPVSKFPESFSMLPAVLVGAFGIGMLQLSHADAKEEVCYREPHAISSNAEISWENFAGYNPQKREIEDSILLALHSPEIYDDIARVTRHKFVSNRPRAVLFEGPPGVSLAMNEFRPCAPLSLKHVLAQELVKGLQAVSESLVLRLMLGDGTLKGGHKYLLSGRHLKNLNPFKLTWKILRWNTYPRGGFYDFMLWGQFTIVMQMQPAALLVNDIMDKDSFIRVRNWVKELQQMASKAIIFYGNCSK